MDVWVTFFFRMISNFVTFLHSMSFTFAHVTISYLEVIIAAIIAIMVSSIWLKVGKY